MTEGRAQNLVFHLLSHSFLLELCRACEMGVIIGKSRYFGPGNPGLQSYIIAGP